MWEKIWKTLKYIGENRISHPLRFSIMSFHFQDCWETNQWKTGHHSQGVATVSTLERRQRDSGKLMQEDLRSHLSCPHTPASDKIQKRTPMEALYKLSRIIQTVFVIILSSNWVGILVLSNGTKGNWFPRSVYWISCLWRCRCHFGLSWWKAALWHFISHTDLAGRMVDPGRHTPCLRKSLLRSQHCILMSGVQICFDPK